MAGGRRAVPFLKARMSKREWRRETAKVVASRYGLVSKIICLSFSVSPSPPKSDSLMRREWAKLASRWNLVVLIGAKTILSGRTGSDAMGTRLSRICQKSFV